MFPYLNGGLFNEEDFDKVGINIPDSTFNKIFAFLDKYNFTIKEDSPLDVEVAVDPQMLGYLYESFANIAEEIYKRNDLGVFYTPVSEVHFMVRRSLVEYFANHLQKVPKDIIYKFVFDEEKKEAIEYISKHNLWGDLEFLIEDVKIVDPACGSGAFLLGCLKALVELTQVIERHTERGRTDFDLKKNIIGNNLFGVDVMKWALHCAELRLWLSMIVEANLPEERRKEPLLPNFNLRLRVGDSLVQKIGDINLNLKSLSISREVKRKLNYLKQEKQKFYSNAPSRKFKDCELIKNEETRIFREILKEEIINKNKEIQVLNNQLYKTNQLNIFGEQSKEKVEKKNLKNEIEFLEEKRELLEKAYEELKPKGKQFVIWEIDFADVFEEKGGFDVVIGNPPYIRQEKISPPFRSNKEVSIKEKIKYKDELIDSIKIKYPFIKEFDRNCDYYIYFYFYGLSLLNLKGTFCFISSSSWLDVDFGKILQNFLVKFVPIKAIYDNQVKRSFAHASINTVIVFFGAPLIKNSKNPNPTCLDNIVKFIMLKKSYEKVISSQNLITIDNFIPDTQSLFGNILKTDKFRVYTIKQRELLEEGIEIKQNKNEIFEDKLSGEYIGSKWGGKYLRAPDIYFTILRKGKGKLIKIGDIAEVHRGFTSGANEFFYVEDVTDKIDFFQIESKIKNMGNFSNIREIKEAGLRIAYNKKGDTYWLLEEEFLKPVIKSPRECKSITIKIEDLKYKVFMCNKSKRELKRTKTIEYITWGEKQKYHKRPTCTSRRYWWNLGEKIISDLLYPYMIGEIHKVFLNSKVLADNNLFDIKVKKNDRDIIYKMIFYLNSTLCRLFLELNGREMTGSLTVLKIQIYEIKNIFMVLPEISLTKIKNVIYQLSKRKINSLIIELGFNPTKPIREQQPNPLPDRKALDDVVFDALGLTEEERKEVYWATAELVKNRLDKARSVKKK
jgi:23S rRNA G2445 N2-methylase RlmL